MMKKLIIIAIVALALFGITDVQAQYVENVGKQIFIDVQDMPSGTWTTTSLNSEHNETSTTNNLYKRLEVAKSDELIPLTWATAKTNCALRGAGWRVPTQKELLLMYIMKDLLLRAGSSLFVTSEYYWSSTTSSSQTNSGYANRLGSDGLSVPTNETSLCLVRCVREVTN